jgi:radical SAM protein with 4Fe4S-binding SPASM domain
MSYILGKDREQMTFVTLSDGVEAENPVRFIEAFVEKIDLLQLGFELKKVNEEGRPSFDPKVLMKLYLYGYLNGFRSSRKLERECRCNVEVHWLLGKLIPNYHTIADFRKDNPKALKSLFRLYVLFLKDQDLIGGEVMAIDGTKFRGSNSKKNNFNAKKIERHLNYIEEKTTEYLNQLNQMDGSENHATELSNIQEKLDRLKKHQLKYESLREELVATGEPQISTTDPDARALLVQGQVVEIGYNQQASVDEKYKLVVATHTLNRKDRNALSQIALETKNNLKLDKFTVLLDKGYHNGREIKKTQEANIETIVATPTLVNSNTHGTTADYMVSHFVYNAATDTYTCPASETLNTTGRWHKKTRERDSYQFKKYRTPKCKDCSVRSLCTGRVVGGREIDRSEYAEYVEKNAENYKANSALYRKRQEINEHIFGTIKRQWNMHYTNLRTIIKVDGEMSLVMTVYNMKRSINILGVNNLIERLKSWKPDYEGVALFHEIRQIYLQNEHVLLKEIRLAA